ncbi:ABC transporter permease [Actinophytocola oryzae]|uniref:ABC-2 type transport system permease protein n=1 Tax=Actinophytocola oryzae TaxID=502181 RepID=A0A4R7VV93_9PSEU|nr:ABC transporter permease [Actinophytocola oryzae]TDV53535.1 ABC-2 type transport system permease protein [Actinophytocola oryzae]
MHPMVYAARTGLRRGLIEFRQTYSTATDLFGQIFWPLAMGVVLFFMRGDTFDGVPLVTLVLPSVMGMSIVFTGVLGTSGVLCVEREDGTLLRARTTPYGMVGYLVGKTTMVTYWIVVGVLILLVPGMFLVDDLDLGVGSWLTLLWVVLLGAVATLPLGAVIGSLLPNPRSQGLVTLPLAGLIAISGIFYPLAALPAWLQTVGQVFPVYWLGLGVRSALLPDEAAAVEVTGSWRHLETIGVLGAWAVAGLVLAPIVLRRMARREAGSAMAARRDAALRRA